jgi:TetR/AcrR family transcriptional regulator, cholesterol catabolism regulator
VKQATRSNLELLAVGKMINSSEAMFDRRRRILSEARKMISRGGLESFNMRDLGARAGVSTRTIYNAFTSKEMVVALAIHVYYESFVSHVMYTGDAHSFRGALARQVTSTLRDVDIPHYMKALVALFYSPTLHPDIESVLLDLASRSWVPWLRRLQAARQIRRGVDLDDLIDELASIQYGRIQKWCRGQHDADEFLNKTLADVLLLIMGATTGRAHRESSEAFDQIKTDPAFMRQLVTEARERIVAMETEGRRSRTRRQGDDHVEYD